MRAGGAATGWGSPTGSATWGPGGVLAGQKGTLGLETPGGPRGQCCRPRCGRRAPPGRDAEAGPAMPWAWLPPRPTSTARPELTSHCRCRRGHRPGPLCSRQHGPEPRHAPADTPQHRQAGGPRARHKQLPQAWPCRWTRSPAFRRGGAVRGPVRRTGSAAAPAGSGPAAPRRPVTGQTVPIPPLLLGLPLPS